MLNSISDFYQFMPDGWVLLGFLFGGLLMLASNSK
jgi:hypothetical protein